MSDDVWATSLRTDESLRQGRGVWAYVRTGAVGEQAFVSCSPGWLDVDMTVEACLHAVARTPVGGTLTIHVWLVQRWVVDGLRGRVDELAAQGGVALRWDIYCVSQDGRSASMERACKVAQLGVAAWRREKEEEQR